MPSEDAHHSFIKCSQQPLLEQATESLLVPLPATGAIANSTIASNQNLIQHHTQPLPPPPPPNNHLHLLHRQHRQQSTQSPLPPTVNSHCYLPKNDPQFHAV